MSRTPNTTRDAGGRRVASRDATPDFRAFETLATALIVVIVLGILYLAREILVPLAIAVLLSFALSPPVKALRRVGINKTISVGLVVLLTFLLTVGIGAMIGREVAKLVVAAPDLQATAMQKIDKLRSFANNSAVLGRVSSTIKQVEQSTTSKKTEQRLEENQKRASHADGEAPNGTKPMPTVPVEVVTPQPGVLALVQKGIGMAASPLATAAFVAIFVVFILMQREDLRNRLIRIAGSGDLQRTTLALNDAAKRLGRYLLAQILLNVGFGVVVALALMVIGVPSAVLWGIVAALMRFIPYIGSIGAALFPVLLAAAADPGWAPAIETACFFLLLETFVGQVVEPLLYGRHTGISPIAVVISATFWTWLWGPVGLVLSTPLTVCLVVIGHHVERLAFLDILLGDAPPLSQVEIYYQRMLAGDPSEVLDHAETFIADHSLLDYGDQIAMQALLMAQNDVRRGVLDDNRQMRIRDTMRSLAEVLTERDEAATRQDAAKLTTGALVADESEPVATELVADDWKRERAVVCLAGRTPLDEAAAHLLADLLTATGIGAYVEPDVTTLDPLSPGLVADARLVVLSFLDADLSLAQARFAVRRLRRQIPDVPVMAIFWMDNTDQDRLDDLCAAVRCEMCTSTLPDALRLCLERARAPIGVMAQAKEDVG